LTIETLRNLFQSTIEFSGMSNDDGDINFNSSIKVQKWEVFRKYKIDVRVSNPSPIDDVKLEFTRKVPKGYNTMTSDYILQTRPTEGYFYNDFALRKGENELMLEISEDLDSKRMY
jgi:hypothetical protein